MLQRLVDIKTDASAAFEKESKWLLVRLDNDLVSIALADKETNSWEAAEIVKAESTERSEETFINSLKQSSSLINYKGVPAKVLVATPQAMAVPTALADSISLFFQVQFGSQYTTVVSDAVDDKIVIAFALQAWQQQLLDELFPEAEVMNTLALLTRQSLLHAGDEGTCLYLHIGKTYAEVVLIRQGHLAIARSLHYETNDDLLYHLLNIALQFNVKPASLSVQLQGFITDEDAFYRLLRNYFTPVSFSGNITPIRHKAFWAVPPHFFTGLMYQI